MIGAVDMMGLARRLRARIQRASTRGIAGFSQVHPQSGDGGRGSRGWRGERANILGVEVSPITMEEALATIEHWIAARTPNYVCITGAHGVIESQSDDRLRAIHNGAGLVTPDGMPLVWMCRALGYQQTNRVYGPDLMRALSALSARRGYRQFYYGGNNGVADLLKETLEKQHPGLQVVGTHTPPFRTLTAQEDEAVVRKINEARPDIVWVGLSTPKQEYWMAAHAERIEAPVMIGIGAAFDFLSGLKPQAPPVMQRNGLEWLYRLVTEPRRLWRRYLSIVPGFLVLAGGQLIKMKAKKLSLKHHPAE
jgi:N-acetylglucosaminyldiphosphoundecaprenol N-acetyl-beta-D-mannosaminyltransferase